MLVNEDLVMHDDLTENKLIFENNVTKFCRHTIGSKLILFFSYPVKVCSNVNMCKKLLLYVY